MKFDLKSIAVSVLAITLAIPFVFRINDALSSLDKNKIQFELEEEVESLNESRSDVFKIFLDSGGDDSGGWTYIVEDFSFLTLPSVNLFGAFDQSVNSLASLPLYILYCNLKICLK